MSLRKSYNIMSWIDFFPLQLFCGVGTVGSAVTSTPVSLHMLLLILAKLGNSLQFFLGFHVKQNHLFDDV